MILQRATSFKLVLHQSDLGARNHRRQEEEEGEPPLRVHAGEAGPPQGGCICTLIMVYKGWLIRDDKLSFPKNRGQNLYQSWKK